MMFGEYERPRNAMGYTEGEVNQKFLEFEANLPSEWESLGGTAFFVSTMLSRLVGSDVHLNLRFKGERGVRAWCENFSISGTQRFLLDSDTFEFFDMDMKNGEVWEKREGSHRRQRTGYVKNLEFRSMRRIGAHKFSVSLDVFVDLLGEPNPPPEHLDFAGAGGVLRYYRHYTQSSVSRYAISRSMLRFERLSELLKEFKGRDLDLDALTVSDLKLLRCFNDMADFDDEMSNRFQRDSVAFGTSRYDVVIDLFSGDKYTKGVLEWDDAVAPIISKDRARRRVDDDSEQPSIVLRNVLYSKDNVEYDLINLLVSDIKKISVRELADD